MTAAKCGEPIARLVMIGHALVRISGGQLNESKNKSAPIRGNQFCFLVDLRVCLASPSIACQAEIGNLISIQAPIE